MSNTPDSSVSTPVRNMDTKCAVVLATHDSEEIYRIADNTHDTSVEDLYTMATPRKKRFPVHRLPTNTPKRFIPPQALSASEDDSPLSGPEISLPSLPSISRLCSGSQENLLDVSMGEISPTPTKDRPRMPEAESMTIEEILRCGTMDNTGLLDLDLNVSASTDDLFWE